MRAIAIALALGFVLTILVQAQQKPPAGQSMIGCVEKGTTPKTFRLTNVEKVENVKSVNIAESKDDLAPHVGHKVEITGTVVPGKEPLTMNVTFVRMVSLKCP